MARTRAAKVEKATVTEMLTMVAKATDDGFMTPLAILKSLSNERTVAKMFDSGLIEIVPFYKGIAYGITEAGRQAITDATSTSAPEAAQAEPVADANAPYYIREEQPVTHRFVTIDTVDSLDAAKQMVGKFSNIREYRIWDRHGNDVYSTYAAPVASAPACDHCHESKDTVRTVYHNGTPVMQVCTDCIIDPVIPVADADADEGKYVSVFQRKEPTMTLAEVEAIQAQIDRLAQDLEHIRKIESLFPTPVAAFDKPSIWTHSTNPYPTYEPSSGDSTSPMAWSWLHEGTTGKPANGHGRTSRNRAKTGQGATYRKPMAKVTQPNMQRRSKPLARKQRPVKPVISITEVLRQMGILEGVA